MIQTAPFFGREQRHSKPHALAAEAGQGRAQDWLALSGKGLVDLWANPFQTLSQGSFVMELRLPLPKGQVLVHWQTNRGVECGFSVFCDAEGRLSILQRSGPRVMRLGIAAQSFGEAKTARLSMRFNTALRVLNWKMQPLEGGVPEHHGSAAGGLPFVYLDIDSLCKKAQVHPAVLWFGFCHLGELPQNTPWIGLRTPVETLHGTVAAGNLKAGDIVLTRDRGPAPLRAVTLVDLPARGSFAPIVLRSPFFAQNCDVLVSERQYIALSGSAVEYLFGAEAVLVAAGDIVDGKTALAEDRRSVISAVTLDLGGAALVGGAEGLTLATGDIGQKDIAPLPCLNNYEAVTLMQMLGRIVSKPA